MISMFISALLISFISNLMIISFSHKHHLFIDKSDTGKPQSFHEYATPRAGGLGILAGFIFLVFNPFGLKFIISILFAFSSGIFEDFHNSLSPKLRLFLQFLSATVAIGLTGAVVTYLGFGISLPYWIGLFFSIFAIVGMMNAVNIIDGFNGLASGVTLIILASFGYISYIHGDMPMLEIISILSGGICGFILLNFPQGKIFLGDGGAYMLGFAISILGVLLASHYDTVSPWYIMAIFIYPVWEVIFSIIRKLSVGASPLSPDAYHFHMLIYRQITKDNALTTLFILAFIAPFMAAATRFHSQSLTNAAIACLFILCYALLYRYLYKKDKSSIQ